MVRSKRYEIDMTQGPMAGNILRFVLPLMVSSCISLMFNAADIVVVGKFVGDASQAAVTSTSPLINLLVNVFLGLSTGVSIVVAQALGAGKRSEISTVVHTGITLGAGIGVLLALAGILSAPLLLRLMGVPEEVKGLAARYMCIYLLGMPASAVWNFGAGVLRAGGDTMRPMRYVVLSGAVNVVLNLIFVVFFHWNVAGVAAATTLSSFLSAGLIIRCLMHETGNMHFDPAKMGIDFGVLKEVARIGMPAGLQSMIFSMSNLVVQSAINSLGTVAMAGSGAAANLGGFISVTTSAFYQSSMTFTSQNRGALKPERIDRAMRWNLLFSAGFTTALALIIYAFGPQLLSIYTNDPEVVAMGMIRLRWVGCFYGMYGGIQVFNATIRSLGYTVYPMVVALVCNCALRTLWVSTVFSAVGTPTSLFMGFSATWTVTIVILAGSFVVIRRRAYAKIRQEAAK